MKIIVDAFGGDNAPLAVIKGAKLAIDECGVDILLVGDEKKIKQIMQENQISSDKISIAHTDGEPVTMEDEPTVVYKSKKDSSLGVSAQLLRDAKGDALVSAGSTGAVLTAGLLIVKRLKGIKRAAIATSVPTVDGSYLLLDSGANSDCRPEMLVQFALMGSVYMQAVNGIKNPRIGLVNNGTEEEKGNELHKSAHQLLKKAPFNFVGNIEASGLNAGQCDVAITDGFTGNVILKLTEGLSKAMFSMIKSTLMSTTMGKIGGALIKPSLSSLKSKLDPNEVGGAPLLGLSKPVIKAHGSSNEIAIKNAIKQAVICVNSDIIGKMENGLNQINEAEKE